MQEISSPGGKKNLPTREVREEAGNEAIQQPLV